MLKQISIFSLMAGFKILEVSAKGSKQVTFGSDESHEMPDQWHDEYRQYKVKKSSPIFKPTWKTKPASPKVGTKSPWDRKWFQGLYWAAIVFAVLTVLLTMWSAFSSSGFNLASTSTILMIGFGAGSTICFIGGILLDRKITSQEKDFAALPDQTKYNNGIKDHYYVDHEIRKHEELLKMMKETQPGKSILTRKHDGLASGSQNNKRNAKYNKKENQRLNEEFAKNYKEPVEHSRTRSITPFEELSWAIPDLPESDDKLLPPSRESLPDMMTKNQEPRCTSSEAILVYNNF